MISWGRSKGFWIVIKEEEARFYLEEETVKQEYIYEYDGMSPLIRAVLFRTAGKKEKEKLPLPMFTTRQYRLQLSNE